MSATYMDEKSMGGKNCIQPWLSSEPSRGWAESLPCLAQLLLHWEQGARAEDIRVKNEAPLRLSQCCVPETTLKMGIITEPNVLQSAGGCNNIYSHCANGP